MGGNRLDAAGIHHLGAVDCGLAGKVLLRGGRNQSGLARSVHVSGDVKQAPNFDKVVRAARGHRVDERHVVGG